jgi:hypothetical protein
LLGQILFKRAAVVVGAIRLAQVVWW